MLAREKDALASSPCCCVCLWHWIKSRTLIFPHSCPLSLLSFLCSMYTKPSPFTRLRDDKILCWCSVDALKALPEKRKKKNVRRIKSFHVHYFSFFVPLTNRLYCHLPSSSIGALYVTFLFNMCTPPRAGDFRALLNCSQYSRNVCGSRMFACTWLSMWQRK